MLSRESPKTCAGSLKLLPTFASSWATEVPSGETDLPTEEIDLLAVEIDLPTEEIDVPRNTPIKSATADHRILSALPAAMATAAAATVTVSRLSG